MSCQPQGSSSKLQVKGVLGVEALWKPENGPGVRGLPLYYHPLPQAPGPAYHTEPRLNSLHSHTQSCIQLRWDFCSGWGPRSCLGTVQLAE